MKRVVQLDKDGYFVGMTEADESPLEPGVYLMPAMTVDADPPVIPAGQVAKWGDGAWVYEPEPPGPDPIPEPPDEDEVPKEKSNDQLRFEAYPSMYEYLDGIVKGDQAQIDKYIADCLAIKAKYPKEN